jgi:hypothetical protein
MNRTCWQAPAAASYRVARASRAALRACGRGSGADRDEFDRALDGQVLETAELVGGYER